MRRRTDYIRVPISADLLMLCQDLGFRLFDTFIWDKGFNRCFGGPLLGSYPYPASIYNNVYFEYIFILKKPGKRNKLDPEIKKASEIDKETWKQYVQKIWRIESETEWFKGHEAVFPEEVPAGLSVCTLLQANDTRPLQVLGRRLRQQLTGKKSIGYEINEELIL